MGVTNDSSASNSSAATDVGLAPYKMAAPPLSLAPFADGGDDERVESPDSPVSVAIDEVDDSSMQKQLFGFDDTTIIFDWDDTLLSSSWLAQNQLRLDTPAVVPPEAAAQLDLLQDSVIALIHRAVQFGTVVIITNAETGWVEMSCKKFMPRVFPLLSGMRVLSARSAFEARFPESPSDWKVQAFFQEICGATFPHAAAQLGAGHHEAAVTCAAAAAAATSVPTAVIGLSPAAATKPRGGSPGGAPCSPRNILSFGDSIHERSAIHKVTGVLSAVAGPAHGVRTKSIKFVERPTVEQLKRQVDLVTSCFDAIVGHAESLDLMLTIHLLYQ